MLKTFSIFALFVLSAYTSPSFGESVRPQKIYFDTVKRIARDGYYSESHYVTTSDGYILEVNRIPNGRSQEGGSVSKKPVVLLMHGLQGSSISYITLGPEYSLGYLLADAGFDVWMGNSRGALNSRNHVSLDPDRDILKFFDYTFEDVATKDLPAIIDYILGETKQEKLHYVGHSQGGTAFLVLNSVLPEYKDKISAADLLAGVGYMRHFPNVMLKAFAISTNVIFNFAVRIGNIEILGPNSDENSNCKDSDDPEAECAIQSISDYMSQLLASHEMIAGASLKQYAHYGQNIRDRSFRRWNYGAIKNLAKYGSINPPSYDIRRISINTIMHYTVGDDLLHERDVLNMAKDMPNCEVRRVAKDSFSHTDFVGANDSRALVSDFVVERLKKLYL